IDENERMEHAAVLLPRSSQQNEYRGNIYLSSRGGFGQFLRRRSTLPDYGKSIKLEDTQKIIIDLLEGLRVAGLVEIVRDARADKDGDVNGYQLPASAMLWRAGDGKKAFHDPIRVPNEPAEGSKTNPFFVEFYSTIAISMLGLEARKH